MSKGCPPSCYEPLMNYRKYRTPQSETPHEKHHNPTVSCKSNRGERVGCQFSEKSGMTCAETSLERTCFRRMTLYRRGTQLFAGFRREIQGATGTPEAGPASRTIACWVSVRFPVGVGNRPVGGMSVCSSSWLWLLVTNGGGAGVAQTQGGKHVCGFVILPPQNSLTHALINPLNHNTHAIKSILPVQCICTHMPTHPHMANGSSKKVTPSEGGYFIVCTPSRGDEKNTLLYMRRMDFDAA